MLVVSGFMTSLNSLIWLSYSITKKYVGLSTAKLTLEFWFTMIAKDVVKMWRIETWRNHCYLFITARVRSTREGTVFTCVCLSTSRGVPTSRVVGGYLLTSGQGGGYLLRSGWGWYLLRSGQGGYLPSQVWDGGYLPWWGVPTLAGVPTWGTYPPGKVGTPHPGKIDTPHHQR